MVSKVKGLRKPKAAVAEGVEQVAEGVEDVARQSKIKNLVKNMTDQAIVQTA